MDWGSTLRGPARLPRSFLIADRERGELDRPSVFSVRCFPVELHTESSCSSFQWLYFIITSLVHLVLFLLYQDAVFIKQPADGCRCAFYSSFCFSDLLRWDFLSFCISLFHLRLPPLLCSAVMSLFIWCRQRRHQPFRYECISPETQLQLYMYIWLGKCIFHSDGLGESV